MFDDLGVVALMGLPGSGKSTLAAPLARELGAWIVSRDHIRLAMFEPCGFTEAEKQAAFQGVLAAVDANCALERLTVIDGMPFSREGEIEAVAEVAARRQRAVVAVMLEVSPELAASRISANQESTPRPGDDRTARLPAEVSRRFRPLPKGTLVLDGGASVETLLEQTLTHLRAGGNGQSVSP
ncbi:MAG: AAA family ATPase [Solirubrobacterales bacterium]